MGSTGGGSPCLSAVSCPVACTYAPLPTRYFLGGMHRAGGGADGAPLAWPAASAPFPPAPEPHAPLPSLCSHALIHTTEVPHRRSPHPHLAPLFLGPTSSSDVLQRLDLIGADGAETRALALLQNLGFSPELRARPMRALSGGWRVRTCLAAAIFARPDVLMLDEPTNHLSIGAVRGEGGRTAFQLPVSWRGKGRCWVPPWVLGACGGSKGAAW